MITNNPELKSVVSTQFPLEIEEAPEGVNFDFIKSITWVLVSSCKKTGNEWRVTIVGENGTSLTTTYSTGAGWFCMRTLRDGQHNSLAPFRRIQALSCRPYSYDQDRYMVPLTPSAVCLFSSLISDASSAMQEPIFDDWADSLGYDSDSRKALDMFQACLVIRQDLLRIGCDVEKMVEGYQDY